MGPEQVDIEARDADPGETRIRTSDPVHAPAGARTDPAAPSAPTAEPGADDGPDAATWPRVADNFREGLVICDATQVVRYVSQVAARLLPDLTAGRLITVGPLRDASGGDDAPAVEFSHADRRLRARRVPLTAHRFAWYVEDVTDSVERADALLAERSRSRFLASASQKLGNPLHEDRAARAAVRLAVPTLGDVAVLVLPPRKGRVRWWRAVEADDETTVDGGTLPEDGLPDAVAQALTGVEPHAADWLEDQLTEAGWLPGLAAPDVTARAVTLPGSGAPTGALVVARPVDEAFGDPDLQTLRGFAARAGAALNAAVLYRDQAEIAETLQASLLPAQPEPVPGLQWGTAYRPAQATLRIGGDFYGAHPLPDGGSLFFLGDVSGKGVEAAVFTGQLRQGIQALRRVESDPARLLHLLNDSVLESTRAHGQGRFATIVLGVAHPARDGGLTLTLAGGGHLPPLLLRADGEIEAVTLKGMLVGVVPDPRIGQATVHLAAGETCLLYSDGVTEARGGRYGDEQYGASRLVEAVSGCQGMPAPALAERVEQVTCDWLAGRDHDDIAVLAVRANPVGGRRPSAARHLHAVPDQRPGPDPVPAARPAAGGRTEPASADTRGGGAGPARATAPAPEDRHQ
ncbi:PP2C family protein-serine/threonine phosphatase [Polymorphospora rubra]|uniref:PP2C family protein-serine/threonine phosphatase n=1 Tax=Polymorphospora rubra TaxID=338584 RepID=UPI0034113D56